MTWFVLGLLVGIIIGGLAAFSFRPAPPYPEETDDGL